MPGPNAPYTNLDQTQVMQRVFDEAQDRLRVEANVVVESVIGEVSVEIDAADGDNIALANADGSKKVTVTTDSGKNGLDTNVINPIKITDGTDNLSINSDGSINVSFVTTGQVVLNEYNEVTSVASSILTTILSKTVINASRIMMIEVSGTNIAEYTVEVNSSVTAKARTNFGSSLNYNFDFKDGFSVSPGDVILARVIHNRPTVGDFNARINLKEV